MEVVAAIFILIAIFLVFIFSIGLYLLTSFVYKKVLEKGGKNGWYGFIPIYRDYVLIEMSGLNWYWILALYAPIVVGVAIMFIPLIGSVGSSFLILISKIAAVNLYISLSKRFKTEDWLTVISAIIPVIGLAIIGFNNKYEFDESVETKPDGFFGDLGIIKNNNTGSTTTSTANVSTPVKVEPKEEVKEEPKEEAKEEVVEEKKVEEVKKEEKPKKTTSKKTTTKKTKKEE